MHLCEKGNATTSGYVASVVLLVLSGIVAATAGGRDRFVPNEIIVKFRAPTTVADGSFAMDNSWASDDRFEVREMTRLVRGEVLGRSTWPTRRHRRFLGPGPANGLDRVYRIKVDADAGVPAEEILAAYQSRPDVEYAELNPVIAICTTPNDPWYNAQWSLSAIQASEAWDTCRGDNDVLVAIIDTGVDYSHGDLQGNLWVNEAELNGQDGFDDDGNGYVDDVRGYNFIDDTNDPMDDNGHGTHCAGIVAAVGNNGLDIAGVCWSATIMPIKVLDASGDGSAGDAVPAIYYAVANGADIISGSWGGDESSQSLQEAIQYAHSRGVLVVVAAGNENSDAEYYPAAYPEVLSVAATDENDHRWHNSNYGNWVDIAAPGSRIRSLRNGVSQSGTETNRTSRMSGTSMAAPHVSGACALLLSANPSLTCDELHDIVTTTGDSIAEGICSSNSRLNVYEALRAAIPSAGTIRLDQDGYADGGRIAVELIDWDLRSVGSQVVYLETEDSDAELVTLAETKVSLGVFQGGIVLSGAVVTPGDGILQGADGQSIIARYLDTDDGQGNADEWRQAISLVDFSPPVVLDVHVQIRGVTATVNFLTDEPAFAEIHYGTTNGGPYDLTAPAMRLSDLPSVEVGGLSTRTTYYFVVWLTDEAGNKALVDDAGQPYSFTTSGRPGSR